MVPVIDCITDSSSDDGSSVTANNMILKVPLLPLLDSSDEASQESQLDSVHRFRLSVSLSNSFPSSALSRALRDLQPDESPADPLSSSCFAKLRLTKINSSAVADDDDLTSLDWLQDINLLRNISTDQPDTKPKLEIVEVDTGLGQKENRALYDPKRNMADKPPYSFSVLIFMAIEASPRRRLPVKDIYNWIAEHFPFYRRAPAGWRNSVRHNLSLNKCFRKVEKTLGKGSSWCIDPLFRPNLLQAMRRTPYFPFHQLQMMSSSSGSIHSSCGEDSMALSPCDDISVKSELEDLSSGIPSPDLCPVLSRRLGQVQQSNSADDIDVANTLASLRNTQCHSALSNRQRMLQKIKEEECMSELVCTPPPHADHLYSYDGALVSEACAAMACDVVAENVVYSGSSPVDDFYDFGDVYCESESPSVSESVDSDAPSVDGDDCAKRRKKLTTRCRRSNKNAGGESDSDEERKRLDGVNALLNLAAGVNRAGIVSRKHRKILPLSSSLWANNVVVDQVKRKRKGQQRRSETKKSNKNVVKKKRNKKMGRRKSK